jgi:hypothetical protein
VAHRLAMGYRLGCLWVEEELDSLSKVVNKIFVAEEL